MLSEAAKAARNEYQRKQRSLHPERTKQQNKSAYERYWERRGAELMAAKGKDEINGGVEDDS